MEVALPDLLADLRIGPRRTLDAERLQPAVKVVLAKRGFPAPEMPDRRCRGRRSTTADGEKRLAIGTPAPATGGRRQAKMVGLVEQQPDG
jgi:hypothetical protein